MMLVSSVVPPLFSCSSQSKERPPVKLDVHNYFLHSPDRIMLNENFDKIVVYEKKPFALKSLAVLTKSLLIRLKFW